MNGFTEEIEFDASKHRIIALSDLLDRDAQDHAGAVHSLYTQFKRKGWCITEINSEDWIKTPSSEVTLMFENFFLDDNNLEKYVGHSKVPHKRSISCQFGEQPSDLKPLPKPLRNVIREYEKRFSEISDVLLSNICELVYRMDNPADVLAAAEIGARSLYASWYWNKVTREHTLIDGDDSTEVNCVPHFDPCLFSISFHSTHEGLQMFDPQEKIWYAAPNCHKDQSASFYAVIWAGYASSTITGGKITPGLHRVVYPRSSVPRLTLWLEVSTTEQVKSLEIKEAEIRQRIYDNGFFVSGFRNFKSTIDDLRPLSIFQRSEAQYGVASNMPLYEARAGQGLNALYQ